MFANNLSFLYRTKTKDLNANYADEANFANLFSKTFALQRTRKGIRQICVTYARQGIRVEKGFLKTLSGREFGDYVAGYARELLIPSREKAQFSTDMGIIYPCQ